MDYKNTDEILHEQLFQLRDLSQSEMVKDEPEQIVQISLAMVEIAKAIIQCQAFQGSYRPLQ